MSRIGKKPIPLTKDVKVQLDGPALTVQGPKGTLSHTVPGGIALEISDENIVITRESDERRLRSLHGLTRTLVANMVHGVTEGFKKDLEIVGVGYRAEKSDKTLKLSVGYSAPVTFDEPDGVAIKVDKQIVSVEGIDKCLVGQTAAKIRSFKKPDAYKGKGIRYAGEAVRTKVGKVGAK